MKTHIKGKRKRKRKHPPINKPNQSRKSKTDKHLHPTVRGFLIQTTREQMKMFEQLNYLPHSFQGTKRINNKFLLHAPLRPSPVHQVRPKEQCFHSIINGFKFIITFVQ